jgi:hypothetical protein
MGRVNKQLLKKRLLAIYKKLPLAVWIVIGAVVVIVIACIILFGFTKKVAFSYAGTTCTQQLTLLPSSQTSTSDAFDVSINKELKIGSWAYAATEVCMTPKQAPKVGEYKASTGLLGGWFMGKSYAIEVGEAPVARKSDIIDKTISTALPMNITLSQADTVHTYRLAVADKTSNCTTKQSQLVCNVADLGLKPGSEYTASLLRSFQNKDAATVVEGRLITLLPIALQSSSLSEAKVVYDMPKEFSFTFDKPVESSEVLLQQKNGEQRQTIETSTRQEGQNLIVTTDADLARKAEYVVTLQQVVAEGGNSLDAPLSINFSTSGGPKPAAVSVGSTGVAQAAKIVVTLDQPVKEGTDVSKFAKVEGIGGSVALRSPTELIFSIQGGLCQAFSLVLQKGLPSGSNPEVSDAWKFDGRTICGTSAVIGSSSKGRPIVAHYFGNGKTTILFTGAIHGSEKSSYTTMQAWVDYLMSNGYKIPADKRVVIVPNTNPDGVAAGSRNSATNVNLGRNFPTINWKADIETASGLLINGGGTSAGSEPEAKALISLTRQLRPRLEISYHAQGRLVGANKFGDSVSIGNTYASIVGYRTMFTDAEAVMGYPMTGEYEDWMGESMGIPAILIELPSHNGNYLNTQLNAMMHTLSV